MLQLKKYQEKAISELEEFLDNSKDFGTEKGHKIAFIEKTDSKYNDQDLDVPFVCIKIPTGGGKTLVGCHMLNSIYDRFSRGKNQKGLVLWLVPTDAIRTQTLNALRNREHPYREVLDHYFSNNIKVLDFKEALSIKKFDIEDNLCILIASLSAFRITDKEGRKAYADNGNLLEHFENIPEGTLDKDDEGQVKYSLMNVIKLANPIVVIDEGHNAKTVLSFDMLKDMNPSFVLEYTATPRPESNVLVNVTASELKDEKMVKIPIYLNNVAQWQQTVREGVAKRKELEKITKKEKGEYIRPIALIQAEQEKEDKKKIYVQKIIDFLIEEGIDESEIAIKTGKQDQISDIDLFSKKCPIRYILTVNALKEGWDNSFAYVLISVANIESRISVEQTIGRIIRLPNTKEKKQEDLNVSYVYTSSRNFKEAASSLEKGLLANGYSKKDFKELTKTIEKENIFEKTVNDDDVKIPFIGIKDGEYRKMDFFQDLIGEDFDLGKQKVPTEFDLYYDQNRRQKVDYEGDQIKRSEQTRLDVIYDFKGFSKERLINWLDKKILRKEYSQSEKIEYFTKFVDAVLESKKYNLSELSINCYKLKDILEQHIDNLEIEQATKTFSELEKKGKLSLDKVFLGLPDKITIDTVGDDLFENHLYSRAGVLNSEESDLAIKIDQLKDVISWWYRSPEKKEEAIYLQGWQRNKFYPDFIVKTKKGNYLLVEYKGENLLTNEDTQYKIKLGEKWQELTGKNYYFFLVHKKNMEEFITKIKEL